MAEILSDEIDFSVYLRETNHKTKVRGAKTFVGEAIDKLKNYGSVKKIFMPWDKTNAAFDFRPGEVTMWSGQNGHGKTQIVTQVVLSLIGQEQKVCVASFEMKPVTTIGRMVRLFSGTNPFSPAYQNEEGISMLSELYDDFGSWTDGRLWLYDQQGTADADTVIGMSRYCAKELGINHVVIDSLMKCVKGEDDYNGQKQFVDELTSLARDNNIHIHLVHHLRKPANEQAMPDKHDTKGSGSITDQIDNLMLVWRNKAKEEDRKMGSSKKQGEPDSYLLCRKQRNYDGSEDGEPSIKLWMHHDSAQFVGTEGDEPMFFPNFPHRRSAWN